MYKRVCVNTYCRTSTALLSYLRSESDAALTPMLKLQLNGGSPNGIHEKDICQQCRSREMETDEVVSLFALMS